MRKFPIFLLVDVSESMAGDGLVQLENGMRAIVSDLMQDPHALENVWMSVIAFAGRPRTLVPLTELAEFVPPHLPIGAGTDLAAALVHLMDEIDRGVQSGTSERKGDWRPLVFLLTDGVPTTDTAAALARWRKNYAGRVSLVAVSIGGGADDTVLRDLAEDVLSLDDTVDGSFRRFITWITDSVKSATRSVTAGAGISLAKLDDDLAGQRPGALPYRDVDDRFAVFTAKCSKTGAPYIVKYERHLGRFQTDDPKLRELFRTRSYALQVAIPVQGDYFEMSGGTAPSANVSSTELIGQPSCPHCGARYGMAVCSCGGIHCINGDGEATCPWCGKTGYYSMGTGEGFAITRGQG